MSAAHLWIASAVHLRYICLYLSNAISQSGQLAKCSSRTVYRIINFTMKLAYSGIRHAHEEVVCEAASCCFTSESEHMAINAETKLSCLYYTTLFLRNTFCVCDKLMIGACYVCDSHTFGDQINTHEHNTCHSDADNYTFTTAINLRVGCVCRANAPPGIRARSGT